MALTLKTSWGPGACSRSSTPPEKMSRGNTQKSAASADCPKVWSVPDKTYNPLVYLDLDEPDALEKMKSLPEWVRKRIEESETYKQLISPDENMTISGSADNFSEVDDTHDVPF